MVQNPDEILEIEKDFFQKIYKKRVLASSLPDPYSSAPSGSIDDLEKVILDDPISTEELESVVKKMKNNKSPGSDSLPVEFF